MNLRNFIITVLCLHVLFIAWGCSGQIANMTDQEPNLKVHDSSSVNISDEEGAILEVIHQGVFRELWKSSVRVGVKWKEPFVKTIYGPQGGSATHMIIYDSAIAAAGIDNEKLHIMTFDNYCENNITINGSFGFIYGYQYYDCRRAGFIYCTLSAWSDLVSIVEEIKDNVMLFNSKVYNLIKDLDVNNTLTITGAYNKNLNVSFYIANMQTENDPDRYHWKDELQFTYHFEEPENHITLIEYTVPGIFRRTFGKALSDLISLPKYEDQKIYTVEGEQGGLAIQSVEKKQTDTGHIIYESLVFQDYAGNDIILNGILNYRYTINHYGQIIQGGSYEGEVDVTGYHCTIVPFDIKIWYNGFNFQTDILYRVKDYSHTFEHVLILLPVNN
ncbi:MAG: hypothetical protein MJB14_03210 [Spirochaetes bacterium]|nr:hypothetical protein [Spirochaetota bacterium]